MNSSRVNAVEARTSLVRKFYNFLSIVVVLLVFAGCDGDKATLISLNGTAVFPPEFRGALGALVPVSNAPVNVIDLQRGPASDPVAIAATDDKGAYAVNIPLTPSAAVLVLGAVRVSGLVDTRNGSVAKNFDGVTDVACQAGVTAVTEGALNASDLTKERIRILERTAQVVVAESHIDFTDADGSRTAAAARVRALSNDGDHLPQ